MFLLILHLRAGGYLPPIFSPMPHCPGLRPVPRPLSIPGALPRTPSAFHPRGAAPYPVRFLERKRSKELAFFDMAGSFIFEEIGIKKIKSRRRDVVKDNFVA